jgi:hypothetical protein
LPPRIPASHGFLPLAQHNYTSHRISLPSTINLELSSSATFCSRAPACVVAHLKPSIPVAMRRPRQNRRAAARGFSAKQSLNLVPAVRGAASSRLALQAAQLLRAKIRVSCASRLASLPQSGRT